MTFKINDKLGYFVYSQFYGWKSFFTYRVQALVSVLNSLVGLATSIFTIAIIYSASSGIIGWSFYQLLFLSLLSSLAFRLVSYFSLYSLPRNLRMGRLDPYLVKPVGIVTLFLSPPSSGFSPISIITAAIFLLYVAFQNTFSLTWAIMFLPLYALGVIALVFFIAAIAVLSYLYFRSGNFINSFINLLNFTSTYPLDVYGFVPQAIFSLLVPIGVAVYYPAEVLLGRIGFVPYAALLVVAIATILISRALIYRLMRRYTGGGG